MEWEIYDTDKILSSLFQECTKERTKNPLQKLFTYLLKSWEARRFMEKSLINIIHILEKKKIKNKEDTLKYLLENKCGMQNS